MTVDPPRLRDFGSDASDDLRALLRSADTDGPTPAQLQRLTARLEPQLSAPGATASTITVGKLIAIVLVVALVAGVIGLVVRRDDESPARPIAIVPIDAAVEPVVVTPPPEPAPSIPPSVVIDAPARTAKPPRPPHPTTAGSSSTPPAPLEDELAVLGRAQRALVAGDAAAALELAERHATLYRSATMIEEREAIAIEALARLHRADAAAARFARFQTAYPRSSYRHRLERLLEKTE